MAESSNAVKNDIRKTPAPSTAEQPKGVNAGWREKDKKQLEELVKELGYVPDLARHFSLEHVIAEMMSNEPFFGTVSRAVNKVATLDIPTAGVGWNGSDVVMWYNPLYCLRHNKQQVTGLIMHELYHVFLDHIGRRSIQPQMLGNVAHDLAVNSMVLYGQDGRTVDKSRRDLPPGGFTPGEALYADAETLQAMKPDERLNFEKLSALVASLPRGQASEWYFQKLKEFCEELGDGDMQKGAEMCGLGSDGQFDVHGGWGEGCGGNEDSMTQRIAEIVNGAIAEVEARGSGWGSIPAEMQQALREFYGGKIDWRQVLKHFAGTSQPSGKARSFHRIDRRLPNLYPGVKKNHVAKILIAIDQSGSVDDGMLVRFFGELGKLSKRIDFWLIHFDTECDEKSLRKWQKNARFSAKRTRCGGTDFDAPTKYVNDPQKGGSFDALLILTDGCAPEPGYCRKKRGWVLGEGCKLLFPSDEIQVFVDDKNHDQKSVR